MRSSTGGYLLPRQKLCVKFARIRYFSHACFLNVARTATASANSAEKLSPRVSTIAWTAAAASRTTASPLQRIRVIVQGQDALLSICSALFEKVIKFHPHHNRIDFSKVFFKPLCPPFLKQYTPSKTFDLLAVSAG